MRGGDRVALNGRKGMNNRWQSHHALLQRLFFYVPWNIPLYTEIGFGIRQRSMSQGLFRGQAWQENKEQDTDLTEDGCLRIAESHVTQDGRRRAPQPGKKALRIVARRNGPQASRMHSHGPSRCVSGNDRSLCLPKHPLISAPFISRAWLPTTQGNARIWTRSPSRSDLDRH